MMNLLTRHVIKTIITVFILSLPLFAQGQEIPRLPDTDLEVAYLSPDAPSFTQTIPMFREQFNQSYPDIPLHEYKVIASKDISAPYIRAATRINRHIYSSAVLERGSEKIKSLQLTLLPSTDPAESSANRALTVRYLISLIHQVDPMIPLEKAPELNKAIDDFMADNNTPRADETRLGSVRYILVKSADNVLTFAVEPIKLSME